MTACLEELAHFLYLFREVKVVATKTAKSKKLRVRDSSRRVLGGMTSVINNCASLLVCSTRWWRAGCHSRWKR